MHNKAAVMQLQQSDATRQSNKHNPTTRTMQEQQSNNDGMTEHVMKELGATMMQCKKSTTTTITTMQLGNTTSQFD